MIKFHPATSPSESGSALPSWIAAALALLLTGEAALHGAWYGFAFAAALALAIVVSDRIRGRATLLLDIGLLGLAACNGIAAARTGHVVYHASSLQDESVRSATRTRDEQLRVAIRTALRADSSALEIVRLQPLDHNIANLLDDLTIEGAIAVIAGDTVLAAAGPHRMQPIHRPFPAALVSTPFARLLIVRVSRGRRQAQTVLLLDSIAGLPVARQPLTAIAGGADGVRWRWTLPSDSATEFVSTDSAYTGVIRAMQPTAPPAASLVAAESHRARLLAAAGILILLAMMLIQPAFAYGRAGALIMTLIALSRAFSDAADSLTLALRSVLIVAVLVLAAAAVWQRPVARFATPRRVVALVMLCLVPVLMHYIAPILFGRDDFSLVASFGWELLLAVGGSAWMIAIVGLTRTEADSARPHVGVAATLLALIAGLIGVVTWRPDGWPVQYLGCWLIPIGLLLWPTSRAMRLVSCATVASVLACLIAWSTSLDRRMDLARADLERLQAPADTAANSSLDRLAEVALSAHATRLDRLYALWGASQLAGAGVPTYMSLWSANGHQREVVALDSLSVDYRELAHWVQLSSGRPERIGIARGAGHHEILVLPLAPDTVATVTIGPRSRLLSPTTFGLLVGWRATTDPPYTVAVAADINAIPDGVFRRVHRYVFADRIITSGDVPRDVRAVVEIATPNPFLIRAALGVLLDVLIALAAWSMMQRMLGSASRAPPQVFQRSYRRTVTTALIAFFMLPAALFTLSSISRLREDARASRSSELAGTVRDVARAGALVVAEAPRPNPDSLAVFADEANADIGVYRLGRLVAASDPLLAELGLLPPVIDRTARPVDINDPVTVPAPLHADRLRLGALDDIPGTLVVAEIPGGDTGLAREQVEQALRLLLAALSGVVLSVLVAGVIADALGRPIDTLRRTAIAIGRHEPAPVAEDIPAEFSPVFGAIRQMEADLHATEAELRAGRARTAAILSTVTTGVIGVDASGDVMHANPRAVELLGVTMRVGQPLAEQIGPEWQQAIASMRLAMLRTPGFPVSGEVDVADRRFAVTLAPLGDGGTVIAITDITEVSRAARIVAWGEMARQVAHEIKNPLTPMRLGLQHLRRVIGDRPPDYPQLVNDTVERVLVEIDRLDRIARSFARYGTPPEAAGPISPVELKPALDELSGLFGLTHERPLIRIEGHPVPVLARREELIQVLLNLLDNARQAGATVVVFVMDGTTLRVTDDGHGITGEQLPRIFEPSFSTTTSGTGLGLAIVRRLVEGWGARVRVESEAGVGASFIIEFVPGSDAA